MLDDGTKHFAASKEGGTNLSWSDVEIGAPARALPQGTMLSKLRSIELELPTLLQCPDNWRTLDVTYHPPRVERIYLQHDGVRIYLHCIHPCSRGEALFHPHPWASAMRVLSESYEMGVGYGEGNQEPPIAATIVLPTGATYEMVDPNAWHYARPIGRAAMTLMITERVWNRSTPKSSGALPELSAYRKSELFEFFRSKYPAGA